MFRVQRVGRLRVACWTSRGNDCVEREGDG